MRPQDHLFYARRQSPSCPAWIVAVVIVAALVVFIWFYGTVGLILSAPKPLPSQKAAEPHKAEIHKRLKDRGLSRNTLVEISGRSYRFLWTDGKFYDL